MASPTATRFHEMQPDGRYTKCGLALARYTSGFMVGEIHAQDVLKAKPCDGLCFGGRPRWKPAPDLSTDATRRSA